MNTFFAVFLCAAVLLGSGVQGILTAGRRRCICPPTGSNHFPRKSLEKVEIHPAGTSCDRMEIIATLKNSGEQRCLNPDSRDVKAMVANIVRKRATRNKGRRRKGVPGRSSPQ